ncbi:MAG: translational GTPase TypA [Alphaproteobacteria bacterium]
MELRNIAIIAHVDHGKTTLVDSMFKQSGIYRKNQAIAERAMDSNDLERERGITILSKCTSILWQDFHINIVDTPGHADFGGEVERILGMVDGVVLLVDAAEGPLPQTKFVLSKALKLGIKPIVVINKVDRGDARPDEVLNEVFDLFVTLDASSEQLDFPTLYACGREGWAVLDVANDEHKDLEPLFKTIVKHVPAPACEPQKPFSMLATTLEADPYIGRVLTGKIFSGKIKVNEVVRALHIDGKEIERARITKILSFKGTERIAIPEAAAGDIVAISGFSKASVADTLCSFEIENPIKAQPIDPPTLFMIFSVNDSPLAGLDGDKLTSRVLGARLKKEAEGNIALRIRDTENTDAFEVAGRGELQLGILIETMRREGFEMCISRPQVLFKYDENGAKLEPIEEVVIDVDEEFSGVVVEKMGNRKGELLEMRPSSGGKNRLVFRAPSRGLIGYHSEFMTDTRGTGIINRLFYAYEPYKGGIEKHRVGVMISNARGEAIPYSLWKLEDRGPMLIPANVPVYEGMIIGEHTKGTDLEVNPTKTKQLTNIRAAGKDENVTLSPYRKMSLEDALSYIEEDELVEVTPKTMRLRKAILDSNNRKRQARKKSVEE